MMKKVSLSQQIIQKEITDFTIKCVEMECSALAAVTQFRGKELFQFFYAADCLDGDEWDRRSLSDEVKFTEKDMFGGLALELAVRICD